MSFYNRKRMRLKDYDYSQEGMYYLTICTKNKRKLFSEIENNRVKLNQFGEIIDHTLNDLTNHNNIIIHNYVIMPNHIHVLIQICREQSVTVPEKSISEIVRQFKGFSSKRINTLLIRNGYEPFHTGELWQKSFYDHIIRNENEFINKWKYIDRNPIKWELDDLYV